MEKESDLIGRSSIRATHTVNQLLALARAESSGMWASTSNDIICWLDRYRRIH